MKQIGGLRTDFCGDCGEPVEPYDPPIPTAGFIRSTRTIGETTPPGLRIRSKQDARVQQTYQLHRLGGCKLAQLEQERTGMHEILIGDAACHF